MNSCNCCSSRKCLLIVKICRINHSQCAFKRKCNTLYRTCDPHQSMNIQLHIVLYRCKIGQQVLNLSRSLLFRFSDQDSLANNHRETHSGKPISITFSTTFDQLPIVRSGSLSRQSTNDSDTDITSQTQSITSSNAQPIKKSPREFIIPIAVEGGGFVTPRAGSLEPSESNNSTFSHLGRPRKIR